MWQPRSKLILTALVSCSLISTAHAWDKGIYLTQYMLESPDKLNYLIKQAKETGINTFIIDHEYHSSHYAPAIAKVKDAGIKDVARIVVFSDGGNAEQIHSKAYWEKKYVYVDEAIKAGANAVQLDYIRYSSKSPANPQHAKDVYDIIKWFKTKISAEHVPMEIDIFGEVSYYPSMHIGQNIQMFADSVDGVNPMVYPSHFWPYQKYSAVPYQTINHSLDALVGQFNNKAPFKVHAFIEAANYHYIKKTSNAQKQQYLLQEIRAVEDAKDVSGWYVWSANNVYDNLFEVLKNNKTRPADFASKEPGDKAATPPTAAPAKTAAAPAATPAKTEAEAKAPEPETKSKT
ncbi:MAG: putative glycoside hydrolase [Gammaproteobacteria bacterium]|nr:putative glycoside hydrolase [Gammaproteobacteria bacterium]